MRKLIESLLPYRKPLVRLEFGSDIAPISIPVDSIKSLRNLLEIEQIANWLSVLEVINQKIDNLPCDVTSVSKPAYKAKTQTLALQLNIRRDEKYRLGDSKIKRLIAAVINQTTALENAFQALFNLQIITQQTAFPDLTRIPTDKNGNLNMKSVARMEAFQGLRSDGLPSHGSRIAEIEIAGKKKVLYYHCPQLLNGIKPLFRSTGQSGQISLGVLTKGLEIKQIGKKVRCVLPLCYKDEFYFYQHKFHIEDERLVDEEVVMTKCV